MEEQLRARLERLVSITNHPIRSIEHKTFRRLLYRNRNQHRHGLYFRKLEHVRRLLGQIDGHVAWESVRHSLGDEGSRRTSYLPLSVSSLTVDDLKSVENLLSNLVNTVIIEATKRVVTDLICREHFMPFAVSIVATLARIFVLERHILRQVRGAGVELNLLFATDDSARAGKVSKKGPILIDEDVGQVVSSPKDQEPMSKPKAHICKVTPDPAKASKGGNSAAQRESCKQQGRDDPPSFQTGSETREPSLYNLVAKQVGTTKFSAVVQERISVSLPEVLGTSHIALKQTSNAYEGKDTTVNAVTTHDNTESSTPMQIRREDTASVQVETDQQQRRSTKGRTSEPKAKADTHASDSEDIDDIFDVLEDSS